MRNVGSTIKRLAPGLCALVAAALCLGCFKAFCEPLVAADEQLEPADAIVVLGFGPPLDKQGRPVEEIVRRVSKGVELYRAGLAPLLIMTGGNTYEDDYESAVMKQVAVEQGVPAAAVLEERQAMDTIGNARYTANLMRERGLSRAIVVSSPYHLKRARRLFLATGLSVQTAASADPDSAFMRGGTCLYEYLAGARNSLMDGDSRVREGLIPPPAGEGSEP